MTASQAVSIFLLGWCAGLGTALGPLDSRRRKPPSSGLPCDWRTRFNHENQNAPQGPPPLRFDPGRRIRGNGSGSPIAPKPPLQGYTPRSSGSGEPNPPPREP